MNTQQREEDKLIPKWKVALIPVLGVTLVVILLPKSEAKPAANLKTPSLSIKQDAKLDNPLEIELADLPQGTIETLNQFNPFKMGEPLLKLTLGEKQETGPNPDEIAKELLKEKEAEARKLQKAAVLEKVKNIKVTLILQTEKGVAAIIDSKTVYVGDELQPGVIVSHIGQDGLRLKVHEVFHQNYVETPVKSSN